MSLAAATRLGRAAAVVFAGAGFAVLAASGAFAVWRGAAFIPVGGVGNSRHSQQHRQAHQAIQKSISQHD